MTAKWAGRSPTLALLPALFLLLGLTELGTISRAAAPGTCAASYAQIADPRTAPPVIVPGTLLPAFPVGSGTGKTARELGIRRLVHFTTPESKVSILTADGNGRLLIRAAKRDDFGAGFYTLRGDLGLESYSRSNGHTPVNLELDPAARKGTDFTVEMDYDEMLSYIVIKNRAAVRPATEGLVPLLSP